MDFLYCKPNVLIINSQYEIILNTVEEGVVYIKIGRRVFYENHTGIMPSVSLVHKFRVPQKLLDEQKRYTVFYKRVFDRKINFPVVGELQSASFAFRPIEKTDEINVFYIADIHTAWEKAESVSRYYGDDLDLYIVNGDFGESSSLENLRDLNRLIGNVTHGEIPAVVGRGNHDTRGKYAEKVTDYMATNDGRAYFSFSAGQVWGMVFDCGEDKLDDHPEYRSLNYFEKYRKDELAFLRRTKPEDKTFRFAVCHVPFMSSVAMCGIFNIMPDLYRKWGKEADRMGFEFMLCGHTHKTQYIAPGDESDKFCHSYPVIVGVTRTDDYLSGCAVQLKKSGSVMRFVGSDGKVSPLYGITDGKEIK